MVNALFNQPNYQAARAMMDMTAARQQAIARNISNLETPGYKRVDVAPSFEADLKQAITAGDVSGMKGMRPTLEVDRAAKANADGNSVVMEDELLKMSENTLAHQLEAKMITGTLLKLRMAITGRPR